MTEIETPEKIKRTLICIVSYEAERHITEVLTRLPKEVWDSPNYHILLSDDGSKDDTVSVAQKMFPSFAKNYTILKLKKNQGYGGNQKVCYRYAIENGFDAVILLHGDAQYAPELVTKFTSFFEAHHVVLGSRMMEVLSAIKGRMPLHKVLGNLVLTRLQNCICQTQLSEFHTGYRGYTTQFLKKIPFERNSDNFHFDTEILLQAFHANASIKEFQIPTFYGDEACRVPGLEYAWNVIVASIRFRLQKMGMFTSLKFPHSSNQIYKDKTDDVNSIHSVVVEYLKKNTDLDGQLLLDIGCGPGHIARKLGNNKIRITGVDLYNPNNSGFDKFIQMNLDLDPWTIDISKYDTVLALDIIEHLSEPEKFLLSLRYKMTEPTTPKVIVSVPNIGFILVRLNLLMGRFNYADRGILDITHKRFFTINSLKRMLNETGFEIQQLRGIGVPFQTLGKGRFCGILGFISSKIARLYPALFAFQILIVTKPKFTTYQMIEMGRQD